MKKSTFLLVFLILAGFSQFSFGQAQRLILVEEYTQASCPPCASQNPGFQALLNDNVDKVVSVMYHSWWPGYDPMYDHNPADADTRIYYYNVQNIGVPYGREDGVEIENDCNGYNGAPACLDQSEIDAQYAVTSPLTIEASHSISADLDSIYVSVTVTALSDVTGDFWARIAVVEKEVIFSSPPGSNGETSFPNVMKKMLPDGDGTSLPSTLSAGWTTTIDLSWALSNIYDFSQLAVVAWVQNDDNKNVLQSGFSAPQPLAIDGAVAGVATTYTNCSTTLTPAIEIKNPGLTTLTSADITYEIDNGGAQSITWNGSLTSGNSIIYNLPAITSTIGSHTLTATLTDINGSADLNTGNNERLGTFGIFGAAGAVPVSEGFVSATFPPTGWQQNNIDLGDKWVRNTQVGGFQNSTNSAKYAFYDIAAGAIDELYVMNFDLSDNNESEASLSFALAKAKFSGYVDQLQVQVSADCGINWDLVYDKDDNGGLSTANSTSNWKPTTSSQWRLETVDLTPYIGNNNVFVKFIASSGFGNNLYIDDINIHYGAGTGIENQVSAEFNLYPNPADDQVTVHLGGVTGASATIEVLNVFGQVVLTLPAKSNSSFTINTSNFDSGIYFYRLNETGKVTSLQKFNITH